MIKQAEAELTAIYAEDLYKEASKRADEAMTMYADALNKEAGLMDMVRNAGSKVKNMFGGNKPATTNAATSMQLSPAERTHILRQRAGLPTNSRAQYTAADYAEGAAQSNKNMTARQEHGLAVGSTQNAAKTQFMDRMKSLPSLRNATAEDLANYRSSANSGIRVPLSNEQRMRQFVDRVRPMPRSQ